MNPRRGFHWLLPLLVCFGLASAWQAADAASSARQVISLNGTWEVAEGSLAALPLRFDHSVPVPGLLDMARPKFAGVGGPVAARQAFWYRRTFRVNGPLPDAAWLKLHKACYGTRVWLNGRDLGEHLPSFTPGWFNARAALRGEGAENNLVIRVGADRRALPDGMPKGFDFEKLLYLPGLYDSVELILSGTPRLVNVQTVPDLAGRQVRVVAEIEGGERDCAFTVVAQVFEVKSKKLVGRGVVASSHLLAGGTTNVDFTIPIANCRLWSPEDPFLYEVQLETRLWKPSKVETCATDAAKVRFGMRSFRFDPVTKRALLNGKPYFLRGSNVTLYRFFEDADRGDLPWDDAWVRRLHRKFKTMHWNSLRYCIGFPPERWYEIADEEGFLIQDEFPLWLLANQALPEARPAEPPDPVTAERLIPEYTEWLRERWNHPCVVIWDAQNESLTAETGKALSAVRHLDLSHRPWDNGWGEPQSPTDCVEAHPYLFARDWNTQPSFRFSQMPTVAKVPDLQAAQKKFAVPILINEYAWLWLNRAGDPTTVTARVYPALLGPNATAAERRRFWARALAAETEFWRAHRQAAGVLHFCSLGYHRRGDVPQPVGGATSDHWVNVKRLQWDAEFDRYLRDAFAPVGVMLDFWAEQVKSGSGQDIQFIVINDFEDAWRGEVRLKLECHGRTLSTQTRWLTVPALGRETASIPMSFAAPPGDYTLVAEYTDSHGKPVASRRDFKIVP